MSVEAEGAARSADLLHLDVLYVEDEDVTREWLAAILRRRVRAVHTARDGEEGLAAWRELKPDIVVTDLRMPRRNGLDMAREIKQLDPGARIIVVSAYSESELLLQAIELEIDGYILKPVESERLFSMLARCAEIVRLRREVRQRDRDQRQLIDDLQHALSEIRTLRGILPICSHCKKIRDDEGYWSQVETYITRHSDVLFSHGICPDCLKLHYPEYVQGKP